MRPEIYIRPTISSDISSLANDLRDADEKEITCLGLLPHRTLWRSFKSAVWSRTVFVDGKIAAIGGVGGHVIGLTGRPWMLTGKAAERVSPIRFARIFSDHVAEMLRVFPILSNYVAADYHKSVKLLTLTGFHLSEPISIGDSGALFRRFEKRANDGC